MLCLLQVQQNSSQWLFGTTSAVVFYWQGLYYILWSFMIFFRGDFIFISLSLVQLKFAQVKNLWFLTSYQELEPSLSLGQNFSKELMKSFSYSLRFLLTQRLLLSAYFTNLFTFLLSLISGPAKGGEQLEISQAKMPKVQRSNYFPQPYLSTISGAQYIMVPASVLVSSSFSNFLARPKSVNFTYPLLKISTFQGFKSLQTIFFECRCSTPKITQAKMNRTACSPALQKSCIRVPFLSISDRTSPPSAHSITRQRYLVSLKAQCSGVMKLHDDYNNIFLYNFMLVISFFLKTSDFGMRFIAYFQVLPLRLFQRSSPKKTSPKPPAPIL